jgi:hypothetical protein
MPASGPTETLRDMVLDAVRRHWLSPDRGARDYRPAKDHLEAKAREALDAMLTRPFRIAKLPPDEEYAQLLAKVRHWVARGKPIHITLGYSPMKNVRAVRECRADWAEFFALGHLCAWHNKVCTVYPPGLRIKIIFDDSTVRMANRVDRRLMESYMTSVARLIPAMGYRSFIVGTMRQSWFAWLFHFGPYQIARVRVRRWERDPANREVLEKMDEYARRNLLLPAGLSEQEQERFYREASHRYRVYWEALQLSRFSRLGHALIGMYLDGTQHHIRQPAALHLASVGKEQVTQPWQGEGALRDNGKGKLVPLVLTLGRRERMKVEEVAGLDLVPMEGFDRIPVCWEMAEAKTPGGGEA